MRELLQQANEETKERFIEYLKALLADGAGTETDAEAGSSEDENA